MVPMPRAMYVEPIVIAASALRPEDSLPDFCRMAETPTTEPTMHNTTTNARNV